MSSALGMTNRPRSTQFATPSPELQSLLDKFHLELPAQPR